MANDADSSSKLKETSKKLMARLDIVKTSLKSESGRSKILTILQDNPCRLRCKHLIQNGTGTGEEISPHLVCQ